ncbi:aminodeoxychorismate synthase component I [Zoogloea sp. LCSB751]|uniref:aminodeoxychorismate synthase component I n=1 Tax=Zoogloea sp. LCSB751 TaxID=1965277 RepID=UPI0020B143A8|nr:aminodeoxychorismate synthase component I [Zoogloea sp. LCSB751]
MPIESKLSPFAFFDNNLDADGQRGAWLLTGLVEEVICDDAGNWRDCLQRLDEAARNGAWVAVAAAYELGYAIEARLRPRRPAGSGPLLQAWIFEHGEWLDSAACEKWLSAQAGDAPGGVGALQADIAETAYLENIERIRRYIADGDCYQVNYTFPFSGQAYGAPAALYQSLRAAQPVRYGAFIRHTGGSILSRSPELFLERSGTTLSSLPMKGTAPRQADPATLSTSEKDRAENVMIVDLIRNDMGRLAPAGGVRVDELFHVEPYPTVWQMISRVVAEPVAAGLPEIFRALFPCGSITGAPKIRAMEIIRELEPSPRGIYCGALGFIRPGGDFRLSVPIRTLLVDTDGQAKLNVGSGVVYDSSPAGEWAECHLKARFLTALPTPLRLIETLRYAPAEAEAFPFLAEHRERLSASARWFGFPFDPDAFRDTLATVGGDAPLRVRVTLGQGGDFRLETAPLSAGAPADAPTVVLSPHRVRSDDPLLRHKTTARRLYDQELARVMADGNFDALFLNERGELTEGARSNLFVQKNGELLTPPQDAGLLNGVLRRRLLRKGLAREATLTVADLHQAEALFVGNGLRGLLRVHLTP